MPVYLFSVDDVDVAEDAGVVCCCFLEGFLNEFVRVMIVNVWFGQGLCLEGEFMVMLKFRIVIVREAL